MALKAERHHSFDEDDAGAETDTFLPPAESRVRRYGGAHSTSIRACNLLRRLAIYLSISCLSILLYEGASRQFFWHDQTISLIPSRNLVPHIPHNKLIRFEANDTFYGEKSTSAWEDLNARGGGWITVVDGEELGLGPPIRYNHKEGYGISVFHQLHCMSAMHSSYLRLLSGNITGAAEQAYHIEHCFDYIRQVLMCHADLALEHRREDPFAAPDRDQVDGWGATHQCRDWNTVIEFVEENRLTKGWKRPAGSPVHDHHGH